MLTARARSQCCAVVGDGDVDCIVVEACPTVSGRKSGCFSCRQASGYFHHTRRLGCAKWRAGQPFRLSPPIPCDAGVSGRGEMAAVELHTAAALTSSV